MTETNKQKRFPGADRKCLICGARDRLASVTAIVYVKHAPLKAGTRVVFCESCIVLATVGEPGTPVRKKMGATLLASLRDVHKTMRGVS